MQILLQNLLYLLIGEFSLYVGSALNLTQGNKNMERQTETSSTSTCGSSSLMRRSLTVLYSARGVTSSPFIRCPLRLTYAFSREVCTGQFFVLLGYYISCGDGSATMVGVSLAFWSAWLNLHGT